MRQDRRGLKVVVRGVPTRANVPATPPRQQHNNPVHLEEFEHEQMGIAPKE